jgi:hypothetical protein
MEAAGRHPDASGNATPRALLALQEIRPARLTPPLDRRSITADHLQDRPRVITLRITCPRPPRGLFSEHGGRLPAGSSKQPSSPSRRGWQSGMAAEGGRPTTLAASSEWRMGGSRTAAPHGLLSFRSPRKGGRRRLCIVMAGYDPLPDMPRTATRSPRWCEQGAKSEL